MMYWRGLHRRNQRGGRQATDGPTFFFFDSTPVSLRESFEWILSQGECRPSRSRGQTWLALPGALAPLRCPMGHYQSRIVRAGWSPPRWRSVCVCVFVCWSVVTMEDGVLSAGARRAIGGLGKSSSDNMVLFRHARLRSGCHVPGGGSSVVHSSLPFLSPGLCSMGLAEGGGPIYHLVEFAGTYEGGASSSSSFVAHGVVVRATMVTTQLLSYCLPVCVFRLPATDDGRRRTADAAISRAGRAW